VLIIPVTWRYLRPGSSAAPPDAHDGTDPTAE
jgi:hypothetical protein